LRLLYIYIYNFIYYIYSYLKIIGVVGYLRRGLPLPRPPLCLGGFLVPSAGADPPRGLLPAIGEEAPTDGEEEEEEEEGEGEEEEEEE
jgi:hypothetical protein